MLFAAVYAFMGVCFLAICGTQLADEKVPLLELRGQFKDTDGGRTGTEYGMLGTVCELPDLVVFVKMIGPGADVFAEKGRFVDFFDSLAGPPDAEERRRL